MTFPNIVDLAGLAVAACRETGSDAPYYYFGHPLEIVNTLMEKDKNDVWKLKKYPAVFLFHDFEEKRDKFKSDSELRIIIVTDTRPEWKASDRYTNVFIPTLIPLYEELIYQLGKVSGLQFDGVHTMKLYPYWGSESTGANVANDYADAIELRGVKVRTFASCVYPVLPVVQFDYTFDFKIQ